MKQRLLDILNELHLHCEKNAHDEELKAIKDKFHTAIAAMDETSEPPTSGGNNPPSQPDVPSESA
jgi:hypothetical protein